MYPTLPLLLCLLALGTYYDVKNREIPFWLILGFMPGLIISLALYLFFYPWRVEDIVISEVFSLLVTLLVYLMARAGYYGFGDVLIVLVTGVLSPYVLSFGWLKVPLLMMSLVLGLSYVLLEIVSNLFHNIRRLDYFKKATEGCSLAEKAYYAVVGKVFTSSEFRGLKFYFPLIHSGMKKVIARVGKEPLNGSEYDLKDSNYVVATKGIPFIGVLTTGYVLSLLVLSFTLPSFYYCSP